jgi:putative ABC transport system substrate-binding protein
MDRRACLVGFLGWLAVPFRSQAQTAGRVHRVGYLAWHASAELDEARDLRERLCELGWIAGRNLIIESRHAAERAERLRALAAELVRIPVDVIVASRTLPALAAKRATRTIPIVFTGVADPVLAGLVINPARPTENLTGFSTSNAELSAERLETLKAVVPGAAEIGVVVNPESLLTPFLWEETQAAATGLGLMLRKVEVRAADSLEKAFSAMAESVGALIVLPAPRHNPPERQRRMARLALRHRLPMMVPYQGSADPGALMTYGPRHDPTPPLRRAATYVDRILRGAGPADLPVQQPRSFQLAIDLRTARALGLTIPQAVLQRADEIIE